ncbi:hypothetical protein KUTeg_020978 [Tegillarca granosa]|uniref:G-protein coupled receptors family 1 profile domain-containing protein n=1 Tax=Tegillarca granosa TaxID=220873 RepID=A0ABQ9EDR6_TEGGR|nr:hypothetical protein KUTeg_020978 [Tegillarca granosa]
MLSGMVENITTVPLTRVDYVYFHRHRFIVESPEIAIPCLIILFIASVLGTFGNVLILVAVKRTKQLHNVESILIVNLAISDMYVTAVADPMSIVAKLEGEVFFASIPGLCRIIGSLCTISCCMSFNRYIHICHNTAYVKLFTKEGSVAMCLSFYSVGATLVMLNLAGIGDHSYDRKSMECIWDRMATYPYTIIFSICLVWIPILITGFSYSRLYRYVQKSRKRVQEHNLNPMPVKRPNLRKSFALAKTLFIIYAVFSLCWIPYALLLVLDKEDTYSHVVHLYITTFAHLHPSINWLVYYLTNKKFSNAFNKMLPFKKCFGSYSPQGGSTSTQMQNCQGSQPLRSAVPLPLTQPSPSVQKLTLQQTSPPSRIMLLTHK